jgi:hypothetical protein
MQLRIFTRYVLKKLLKLEAPSDDFTTAKSVLLVQLSVLYHLSVLSCIFWKNKFPFCANTEIYTAACSVKLYA